MWRRDLEKKRCLWFEAAMLEYKTTCVLWPLEGSRRAGQREHALPSSGVKCCDEQETNRRVYLVFYRPLS